ncbi:MAG: hypothetical protein ACOX7U_04580 [Desulfitobacteriia bacterium]
MSGNKIAPQEAFGIHELLQLRNIWALKCSSLTGKVAEPKLRLLLETELENSQQQIQELRELIQESDYHRENKN